MVGRRVPLFGRVGMAERLRVVRRTAGGFRPVHLQIYGKIREYSDRSLKSLYFSEYGSFRRPWNGTDGRSEQSRFVVADDLFEQAKKRQKQNPGTQYLGTVLQHLVAAKLCLILPEGSFEIHGASVADGPTDRNGDFVIGNTVIHCTTMRVHTALNLAEDAGLAGRVEVWDIQQFLSANVYEHSLFDEAKRNATLSGIIDRYNKIVLEAETDPSLRIEFEAR